MKMVLTENINKYGCLVYHSWVMFKNTGATEYQKCILCGGRRILSTGGGYQPIDWNWVNYKDTLYE